MTTAPTRPDSIGPYKILDVLGEGGMGTVYLAEQRTPVHRRAALKVIKLGLDTKQALARFELERQALALMDHAHVARVYDAGATPEGHPWFAMELVRGESIDTFCDKAHLTVRERIELFRQVCAAVQHAHHKGIVHRDLKPSNILVTTGEDGPVAKIIDFGVARALDHRLTEQTLFTERGQLLGTPEYMSPEQADPACADIDTRTDVYSLGAILYQLLAGALPFDPRELRAGGYMELQRQIREVMPPKPSTRVITRASTHSKGTTATGLAPRGLSLQLRGELDWIVMKALEKDRARRYQTASELAADLERYLTGAPVLAGPPSTLYRLRKLVSRHRGAAAAVVAIVLSLALGLVVSLAAWRDAEHARQEAQTQAANAERARQEAQVQAAKSGRTAQFAQDMLSGVDPTVARGMDTKLLRTILDQSGQRIDSELRDQPEVEVAMRETVAAAYSSIAAYDLADRHMEQAAALARRTFGKGARPTLRLGRRLTMLRLEQGRYAEAEQIGSATLEAQRAELGPDDPDTLATMGKLGVVLRARGEYTRAEAMLRDALARLERVAPADDPTTLDVMMNLAVAVQMQDGRTAEAETLHRRVLAGKVRRYGADHPSTFLSRGNLALVVEDEGRMAEAEQLHRDTVADLSRVYGPEHPTTLRALNNLGTFLYRKGDYAAAIATHRAVLEARRRVLGPDDPMTLFSLNNLGETLQRKGDLAEAETVLQQAYDGRRRVLGEDAHDTLLSLSSLAFVRSAQRRFADAAELFGLRAAAERRKYGDRDSRLELTLYNQAAMLQDAGQNTAAEPIFREILERHGPLEAKPQPWLPAAQNGLAKALLARGDAAGAETLFRDALAARRRIYDGPHSDVADSLQGLGETLLALHRPNDALPFLRETVNMRQAVKGTPPSWVATAQGWLGECLCALGQHAEAEPLLLASEQVLATDPRDAGAPRRGAAQRLATLYSAWGKATEAAAWRSKVAADAGADPIK